MLETGVGSVCFGYQTEGADFVELVVLGSSLADFEAHVTVFTVGRLV